MKSSERKKDLKAKSPDDLQKELMDLLSVQFKLRMQKATQQLTNTAQIRRTRRDIARVRTLIAQAKAGAAGAAGTVRGKA
jgi:large subunit ribosomal protein L29